MSVLLACVLAAERADAQQGPADAMAGGVVSEARVRFDAGVAAAADARWADAAAAFAAAYELVREPVILFNLAAAQARLGRTLDAARTYRSFLERATAATPEQREAATAALRDAEAQLAVVRVRAPGLRADDRVALDHRTLEPRELDAPIEVEPGRHEAVRQGANYAPVVRALVLAAGGRGELELAIPPPARTAPPPPARPGPVGWPAITVGALALATGGALALVTNGIHDAFTQCDADVNCATTRRDDLAGEGQRFEVATFATAALGAVLLTTGIVLQLVGPPRRARAAISATPVSATLEF